MIDDGTSTVNILYQLKEKIDSSVQVQVFELEEVKAIYNDLLYWYAYALELHNDRG